MNKKTLFKTAYILLVLMIVSSMVLSSSSVSVNESYISGMAEFMGQMYRVDIGEDGFLGASLNGAMEGMPVYSSFELSYLNEGGAMKGIGANLEKTREGLKIVSVVPASPAYEAGLETNDVIIRMDKQNTAAMGIDSFKAYMAGHDSALFEIRDADSGLTSVIRISSAPDYRKDVDFVILENAGYIRFNYISPDTQSITEGILSSLSSMGIRNVIIDVRDMSLMNVAEAAGVAGLFMESGRIASSRNGIYHAPRKSIELNIAILVNEKTAGAGEILASAVPGTVYGKTTAGEAWDIVRYPVLTQSAYEFYSGEADTGNVRSLLHHIDFMDLKVAPDSIAGYLNLVESKVSDSSGRIINSGNRTEPDVAVEDTAIGYMDYRPGGDMIEINRNYSKGSVNYDVYIAKKILSKIGIFDGPMDVVFGDKMVDAVNMYKAGIGYPADGILDKSTQAMLNTYSMQEAVMEDTCVKAALADFN